MIAAPAHAGQMPADIRFNRDYIRASIANSRYEGAHVFADELPDTWVGITRRTPPHSLHTVMPRLGGFPPALARWVIERYSMPGDLVLDPFAGKGTVVLEALLARRDALGNDAAPEAYLATRAKSYRARHDELEALLEPVSLRRHRENVDTIDECVRLFYHPETLSQILDLRDGLMRDIGDLSNPVWAGARREAAIYGLACLAGILHGPSGPRGSEGKSFYLSLSCSHTHSQSPSYVRRFAAQHGLVPPKKDVIDCVLRKSRLVQADGVPPRRGEARCEEALTLATARAASLVLTSPPYFRAQMYAWDNSLRLWLLGYSDYHTIQERLVQTASIQRWAAFIEKAICRFDTLLTNAANAIIAIVVGDVRLEAGSKGAYLRDDHRADRYIAVDSTKGPMINTSEIVADALTRCGFCVEKVINDYIRPSNGALRSFLKPQHGCHVDRIVIARRVRRQP